jgi:hypothetical protein
MRPFPSRSEADVVKKKLKQLALLLPLGMAVAGLASSAGAQGFPPGGPPGQPPPGGPGQPGGPGPHPGPAPRPGERSFRDRDPRHFSEHDLGVWRGGGWRHDWHDGRYGWWWLVGPDWFFYPQPIYPYPDPYLPSGVALPPAPAPAGGAPPAQYWYYCDNPAGYYPYVASCTTAWRPVPATPQGN